MGRWNDSVSRPQRSRKKRYCRRMGCEVRKLEKKGGWSGCEALVASEVVERLKFVVVLALLKGRGSGGEREGPSRDPSLGVVVAFSIRAQVR